VPRRSVCVELQVALSLQFVAQLKLEQAVRLDSISSGTGQTLGCTRLSGSMLMNDCLFSEPLSILGSR
jgi:hypothetical protein